jgi:hypothetical protein
MTTAATPTNKTESLDDVLARIDALAAPPAPVPVELSLDQTQFASYVAHHMTKAETEEGDAKSKRLDALKAVVIAAKQAFAAGQPAKVTPFDDSFKLEPKVEGTANVPTGTGSEGVALENNDVVKGAAAIAKSEGVALIRKIASLAVALKKEGDAGALVVGIAKAARSTVAKAGEAAAMLEKLAGLFGIDINDPEMEGYNLRWKISDAVCAIQEAAELEKTMATLSATLGAMGAPAAPAAPPATPTQANDSTTKADVTKAAEGDWPMDMSSTKFDARAGKHVAPSSGWNGVGGR